MTESADDEGENIFAAHLAQVRARRANILADFNKDDPELYGLAKAYLDDVEEMFGFLLQPSPHYPHALAAQDAEFALNDAISALQRGGVKDTGFLYEAKADARTLKELCGGWPPRGIELKL